MLFVVLIKHVVVGQWEHVLFWFCGFCMLYFSYKATGSDPGYIPIRNDLEVYLHALTLRAYCIGLYSINHLRFKLAGRGCVLFMSGITIIYDGF